MADAHSAFVAAPGAPIQLRSLRWRDPAPTEVLVDVVATGICHTDVAWAAGDLFPRFPVVVGHETAGVVAAVGSLVTRCAVGDRVLVSLAHHCGRCPACERGTPMLCANKPPETLRLSSEEGPVYQGFGVAGLSSSIVIDERSTVPLSVDIPSSVAAVIGCAVATGWGAVNRLALVRPGETVAVLGCGAIGLSAVMSAALAGAAVVVAVDPRPERRAAALAVGARSAAAPDEDWQLADGFDQVLEASGQPSVMAAAVQAARPGGSVTLIGAPPLDATLVLPATDFVGSQRRIVGCQTGNIQPHTDLPAIASLFAQGRLPLDALLSGTAALDDVATAMKAAANGEGIRIIVEPNGGRWTSHS